MNQKDTVNFAELLSCVADDKLVMGHRNSDWTGLGPILEEDIAFSALAQADIAHAQAMYEHIGTLVGRTADQLAFGRTLAEYRCAALVEIPDDFDWAVALVRQFFCCHYDDIRLERLARSSDADTAALCRRLLAEQRAHVDHASEWMRRLAATPASRERVQAALEMLAPNAASLHEPIAGEASLVSAGLYPPCPDDADPFDLWSQRVHAVLDPAGFTVTIERPGDAHGGRRGVHTPHLAEMLEEMGEVWRLEPNAAW